jgi:hypothetical protein
VATLPVPRPCPCPHHLRQVHDDALETGVGQKQLRTHSHHTHQSHQSHGTQAGSEEKENGTSIISHGQPQAPVPAALLCPPPVIPV